MQDIIEKLKARGLSWSEVDGVFMIPISEAERDALLALVEPQWQPIETAPKGYDGTRFHYVLFRGVSKSRSLSHPVVVSGYMGSDGRPIVNYQYALVFTHWMPLPAPPSPRPSPSSETPETRA